MLHGFLLIYKDTREPPKFNLTWNPCHLLLGEEAARVFQEELSIRGEDI